MNTPKGGNASASGQPKKLPAKPSLEHLQKQAKRRARQNPSLKLAEAQHQLAQEYGCKNWTELAARCSLDPTESQIDSRLISAVCTGDLLEVRRLLDEHPKKLNLTGGPQDNLPLIHNAAYAGQIEIVKELIRRGEAIDRQAEDGSEPLSLAALGGSVEMVEFLRNHGAMHWNPDKQRRYAYDYAKQSSSPNKSAIMEILGGLSDIKDPHFRAALGAINHGDLQKLKEILQAHPYLATARNEENSDYFRHPVLMHYIAENPCRTGTVAPNACKMVQLFLDAGTPMDITTEGKRPHTLLDLVASSFPVERCGLLTALMEPLIAKGVDSHRALHVAVINNGMEAAKILLQLGAQPKTLAAAAGLGLSANVREFLQTDNSLSLEDKESALGTALNQKQSETAELLLDSGISRDKEISTHGTPLHYAAINGLHGLVEKLVANGAPLHLKDRLHGGTPADWARVGGHVELSKWLSEQAAKAVD